MSANAAFIPVPLSVFKTWNFSQFYTFYYLRKHCHPSGFFRVNNYVGLKKDPMKINRSTFFKARSFLERVGVISIKHPPRGLNSGSKSDGIIDEKYLKIQKKLKNVLVLRSYLEKIQTESDWREYRLHVLKNFWEEKGFNKKYSFKKWLTMEFDCPITGKKVKSKGTNFRSLKSVLSKKLLPESIFYFRKNRGTNKDGSTLEKSKINTNYLEQMKTIIIENNKLFNKQFRVGESKYLSEFTLPENQYLKIKNCFLNIHKEKGLSTFNEERDNLLISLIFLSKSKIPSLKEIDISSMIQICLSAYYRIESSRIKTKTNYLNRFLSEVEKNQNPFLFNEYESWKRKEEYKNPLNNVVEFEETKGEESRMELTSRPILVRHEILNNDEFSKDCFGSNWKEAREILRSGEQIPDDFWKDGYDFINGNWINGCGLLDNHFDTNNPKVGEGI